jgi:mannitol/fructose-specific phosphotransferase system IIA component (Ntr-type)
MRLADKLRPELVLIAPEVDRRDELFRLFGSAFEHSGLAPDGDTVVEKLLERERILSTGIGGGVAVPHAQVPGIGRLAMAVSIHPSGIEYPALDDQPVRLVFCLIGDANTAADHLAGLARLARLARRDDALDRLIQAETGGAFLAMLAELEGA